MCNVYSFSGFAKVLIKNKITFSFRDFLNDQKVDELIQTLVDKTCYEGTYEGAGIARSCFIDNCGECAIKVDKDFYVDYSDENARSDYDDMLYWEDRRDEWIDGAWVVDSLNVVTHDAKYIACDQNIQEIDIYNRLMRINSHLLGYMPRLYATSTNKAVEVLELCGYCHDEAYCIDKDRFNTICSFFDDTHDGNFGINSRGELVILDVGFGIEME